MAERNPQRDPGTIPVQPAANPLDAKGDPNDKSGRERDLKKLEELQSQYDELKEQVPREYDPNRRAAALGKKGELTREMDKIKRKWDVQPGDLEKEGDKGKGAKGAAAESGDEDDPVKEMNPRKAIDAVGRMRKPEKLQAVIDNDTRPDVQAAARERLAALNQ